MNSNDENFEWYKSGVYVAHDSAGVPMLETMQNSAHGARASLIGRLQCRWEPLREQGYTIQEYVPAIPVLTDVIKVGDQVAVATEARWYYPAAGDVAPLGVTVQLLTRGGVAVRGVWNDLGDYIAWAPMIKRDKDLEARLGL
jgi:hypothetical protein